MKHNLWLPNFSITWGKKSRGLDQGIQESTQSFKVRLDKLDKAITEIRTEQKEQHQTTDAPRVAHQAVQIGERYAVKLEEKKERYNDENDDYLEFFGYCLRKFGVTNSNETANAIHVALKTFPVLEVADTRIIRVWRLMCGEHLHVTQIDVGNGMARFTGLVSETFFSRVFWRAIEANGSRQFNQEDA